MKESRTRSTVLKALKILDARPVENSADPGTPDVNYIGGWVELKQISAWPSRPDTPVRCDHFTPQQRGWLIRRGLRGGRAWLLLQVRKEWLLFNGSVAAEHLGTATKEQLISICARYWPNGLSAAELRDTLVAE